MDGTDSPAKSEIDAAFLADVLAGLAQPQKTLPCQYFYDEIGSGLFEDITRAPEYYPTRTEAGILRDHAAEIAAALGAQSLVIEYGAGASVKTRLLLDAMPHLAAYVPIDVSREFLLQTAADLRDDYPNLAIYPVAGNFMNYELPADLPEGRRVGFFPGSTIGNLSDAEIFELLTKARQSFGPDARFLIGVDLHKSEAVLIPAYQDAAGITARFNLNLLERINRELGGDFDTDQFRHEARWNEAASRVEMHLVSRQAQTVTIADTLFTFTSGETIHTENSRKFKLDALRPIVARSGWRYETVWQDPAAYFALILLLAH